MFKSPSKYELSQYKNREIMQFAWTLAREAQRRHGGKASEYFAECLKASWRAVKNARKCYDFAYQNEVMNRVA